MKTRIIICVEIKPGVRIQIIFDSGANHHVLNNIHLFRNLRNNEKVEITTVDGIVITSTKFGDVYWLRRSLSTRTTIQCYFKHVT